MSRFKEGQTVKILRKPWTGLSYPIHKIESAPQYYIMLPCGTSWILEPFLESELEPVYEEKDPSGYSYEDGMGAQG